MKTATIILFGVWLFTGWAYIEECKKSKESQKYLNEAVAVANRAIAVSDSLCLQLDTCRDNKKTYSEAFMILFNEATNKKKQWTYTK